MTKSRGILAPRHKWTDQEVETLRALYPNYKTADVATILGRPTERVYQKANTLGLRKSDAYLASPAACRLRRGDNVGAQHRFQKGQATWNKGMKGLQIGGEQSQFKPGQQPRNTLPIGSMKVTDDGILRRKVSEGKGSSSKRWRAVHELVWVEANGPVPPRHIVVFKSGMKTAALEEITVDRVECITFAENMRRNTVHNYPKEIAQLVLLRGALNRQINKRTAK